MKKHNQVWTTEFEGHAIKVINSGKAKLYIDGEEVAKEKGLINFVATLQAEIPGTDYIVTAKVDGTKEPIVLCDIIVGKRLAVSYGKEAEDGSFTPYTEQEIEEMKEANQVSSDMAAIIATMM